MRKTASTSAPAGAQSSAELRSEAARDTILQSYAPHALEGDSELAAITRFAAKLCQAPIAAVTVPSADRERFLVHHGSTLQEIPSERAFCPHAMKGRELMQVLDAARDPRFADYASVTGEPHVRFYAGQPLVCPEGIALGTLSIIDSRPRPEGLSELQREGLAVLAEAVMLRLRAHRKQLAIAHEAEAREAQLRTLVDSIPAIAWSADGQGNFEHFNKRMVEYTGDPDDKGGKSFHPDDWERASAAWQRALRTGEPYQVEHRLRRHDGEYRWMISRAVPVRDEDGTIVRWFGTAVDIHDIYAASEARDLLAKELSHRIKNIFAVISGLVSLSVRKRPELAGFADELTGMIRALGRAHEFVRPVDGEARDNLHGLLEELFAPYGDRIEVRGDDFAIASRAATPLALVFHELATNAAKYGALANEEGRIELTVKELKRTLRLRWRERGGKPPRKNPQEGFGTRLVEMSVTHHLDGTWERRFEPDGLVVELTISKQAVAT